MRTDLIGMPCISLWQPWASWVDLGYKKIETRTHNKFKGLMGKRIAIHAAKKWDKTALYAPNSLLSHEHFYVARIAKRFNVFGCIICTAYVFDYRLLGRKDSIDALIDCSTVKRYGLFLSDIKSVTPHIPYVGGQGIFTLKEVLC
jgi:hypothetical protein